jgi:hypothetical protein
MKQLIILTFILFFAGTILPAEECMPLYRYAYDNWMPEPYPLNIYYKGYLTEKEKKVVDYLKDYEKNKAIALSVVNLSNPKDSEVKKVWLWNKQKIKTLPYMLLLYPSGSLISANAWDSPLKYHEAKRMLNSPKRKTTATHLRQGCAAVWLLLECGRLKDDENAALFLKSNLKLLNENKRFKDHKFAIVRIPQNDKKERFFLNLLRHVKSASRKDIPVIIPVFGRGRAIYALSGDLISTESIREICEYLVQPCAKGTSQNIQKPGLDLLLGCDWDEKISPDAEETEENGDEGDDESEEDKKVKAYLQKQLKTEEPVSIFGSPLFFISIAFLALMFIVAIISKSGKK